MKKNWKLATLALATTGMMLTTACTDDTIGDDGNGDIANNILNADITEDVTLKAGETYPRRAGSKNRCAGYSLTAHRNDIREEGSRSMGRTSHLRIRTYKRGHRYIRNR